jgi:hypothetical protein
MKKGLAWSWLVLIVIIISTVATVAFVFKTPFKFEIESGISRKELEEFLKKESQEPENYILEQTATTNIQGSGEEVESYLQALKLSEIKATYKTMKMGKLIKTYTEIEKPTKEVTSSYDFPYLKDDYDCKKEDGNWSCKKTWYVKTKPEFLEMLGMEYLENLEEALGKKDLVEIHGTKKRCFGHDCICVNVDARKLLEEAFKKSVGEAAKVDKFSAYSCMEEKSKINLEMKIDYEISFKAGEKRSSIKIVGNVNTLRFEETEPPLEEFRLPIKGEKKILYVCENCEYQDFKKALDEADIGDTIMITDKREYENEVIDKLGIVIDCGGSSLRIDDIEGSNIILKNCKLSPIKYGIEIYANKVEIIDSIVNGSIDAHRQIKIVNSKVSDLLHLSGVDGAEIKNNQINGVGIRGSKNINLENNIIENSRESNSIAIYNSMRIFILRNRIINSTTGIFLLENNTDINIEENTIQGRGTSLQARIISSGIDILGWGNTKISIIGNRIENCAIGISKLKESKEIEIERNSFINVIQETAEAKIEETKQLQENPKISEGKCTNHAECSQACTTLCPANVYGCCYGCKLGQCINGKCECVEAVDYCSRNPNYQVGTECIR